MVHQGNVTFGISPDHLSTELNIKPEFISLIIEQFEEMALCKIIETKGFGFPPTCFIITLTANAYDVNRNGGFVFKDKIMKANLSKLDMEIAQLSEEASGAFLNRVQKIASIWGAISSSLPFIDR